MSTETMFGDLKLIDIMAERTDGTVELCLVCNGYIDGAPQTQTALLDKLEGYLTHIHSQPFQKEYAGRGVILTVFFSEKPDPLILDLLYKCQSWAQEHGAKLELQIDHKKMRFTQA